MTRIFLFCLCLLFFAQGLGAQSDPFKRRSSTEAQESQQEEAGPNWVDGLIRFAQRSLNPPPWFQSTQRSLHQRLSSLAIQISEGSIGLSALAFGIALAFGFIHVVGPGHGKFFTISYFCSKEARLRDGLWMSALINLIDSISAGLVVLLSYGFLASLFGQEIHNSTIQSMVASLSYGIILVWSIAHLIGHRHGKCGHEHHSHDSAHQKDAGKQRSPWFLAIGVGLIPCPISTALLIFGWLNGLLGLSIFLILGVSLGGFLAMSLLSLSVIGSRQGVFLALGRFLQNPDGTPRSEKLSGHLESVLLILMALFAVVLLLASWSFS